MLSPRRKCCASAWARCCIACLSSPLRGRRSRVRRHASGAEVCRRVRVQRRRSLRLRVLVLMRASTSRLALSAAVRVTHALIGYATWVEDFAFCGIRAVEWANNAGERCILTAATSPTLPTLAALTTWVGAPWEMVSTEMLARSRAAATMLVLVPETARAAQAPMHLAQWAPDVTLPMIATYASVHFQDSAADPRWPSHMIFTSRSAEKTLSTADAFAEDVVEELYPALGGNAARGDA